MDDAKKSNPEPKYDPELVLLSSECGIVAQLSPEGLARFITHMEKLGSPADLTALQPPVTIAVETEPSRSDE